MSRVEMWALRGVLIALALYGVFLGLDFGWGGIAGLGWQGATDFLTITEAARYGVQDSHFRFLGGVFAALSVFIGVGTTDLRRYRDSLRLAFALIFIGGLARLTVGDATVLSHPDVVVALVFETVVMGALYVWVGRSARD
jgi:hypothetical protein